MTLFSSLSLECEHLLTEPKRDIAVGIGDREKKSIGMSKDVGKSDFPGAVI